MKEFLDQITGAQITVSEQGLIIEGGKITLHKKFFPRRGESGIVQHCNIQTDDSDIAREWFKQMTKPILPIADTMDETVITQYVVYFDLPDYPEMYVAIKWEISEGEYSAKHDITVGGTIEEVRSLIPPQYNQKVPRCEQDAPEIVETWVNVLPTVSPHAYPTCL